MRKFSPKYEYSNSTIYVIIHHHQLHYIPRIQNWFNIQQSVQFLIFFFFKLINLFLERWEGREKERERNINVWVPLACPLLGTWLTTQSCALTGNLTLCFSGEHSIHWATPARPILYINRLKEKCHMISSFNAKEHLKTFNTHSWQILLANNA